MANSNEEQKKEAQQNLNPNVAAEQVEEQRITSGYKKQFFKLVD